MSNRSKNNGLSNLVQPCPTSSNLVFKANQRLVQPPNLSRARAYRATPLTKCFLYIGFGKRLDEVGRLDKSMKGKGKNPSNLSTRLDKVGRMKARFAATMNMQRPYVPADLAETPGNKKPAEVAGSLRPVARADH